MKKQKHLLFLIESEIRAIQLMNLLEGQQIDFDLYLTDHSTLIFEFMNIHKEYRTDELYSTYFSLLHKGKNIDLENDLNALKQLSLKIYTYLVKYKELCAVLEECKPELLLFLGA